MAANSTAQLHDVLQLEIVEIWGQEVTGESTRCQECHENWGEKLLKILYLSAAWSAIE